VLARVTRYAPLVVALSRLAARLPVTGADLCAATAALHCLFATFVADPLPPAAVLEHSLEYFAMLAVVDDAAPLQLYVGAGGGGAIEAYCAARAVPLPVVLWEADLGGDDFEGSDIAEQSAASIAELAAAVPHFKPLSPTALRFVCSASLMAGPRLFLGHAPGGAVRFIDPAVGRVEEAPLDALAAAADGVTRDDAIRELENARFDQIIDVCIDESRSMGNRLDGKTLRTGQVPRIRYAREYLAALLARVERCRVSTIFGLLGFSDAIGERAPLSPLTSRFGAALQVLEPSGAGTRLWDAIDAARERITQFNDGAYPNALQRIIVITDGEDEGSAAKPADVAGRLVADAVVVDAVVIGTDSSLNRPLAALCAATGGALVRPAPERAAEVFEAEAFVNLHVRERPPAAGALSPDDFARRAREPPIAKDAACFANAAVAALLRLEPLVIPGTYLSWESETRFTDVRSVRLFAELRVAAKAAEDEIRVFPANETIERWVVFVRGPDGSVYDGLWWALALTFPALYPMLPPVLRFASVPYHPNVAREGRVFFSGVELGYTATAKIADILGALRHLLEEPELADAVERGAAEEWARDSTAFERKARAGSVNRDFPPRADWHEFPWTIYQDEML
jgi:ubiquitin-protein ligase